MTKDKLDQILVELAEIKAMIAFRKAKGQDKTLRIPRDESAAARIRKFLSDNPQKSFKAYEIARALNLPPRIIYQAINRAVNQEVVMRIKSNSDYTNFAYKWKEGKR